MARDREEGSAATEGAEVPSVRSRVGLPLIVAATFAAGAGAALAAKSVLESRRKGSAAPAADAESDEDLAGALRRAALDVAIAATNEAATRLSVEEESEAVGAESR